MWNQLYCLFFLNDHLDIFVEACGHACSVCRASYGALWSNLTGLSVTDKAVLVSLITHKNI